MWDDIKRPWRACLELAWEAYVNASVPVGAVITDERGVIIAEGRNRVFDHFIMPNRISNHPFAHAEIDAMLQISSYQNKNIRDFTLYTTCEPCYFCFGAMMINSMKHLKFAARDKVGGATRLNISDSYIKKQNIEIDGPDWKLEPLIIALQTCYELNWIVNHSNTKKELKDKSLDHFISVWSRNRLEGTELGIQLFRDGSLEQFKNRRVEFSTVFQFIQEQL